MIILVRKKMKYIKISLLILILTLFYNCHFNKQALQQKASAGEEFHKMAWMEGLWSNPDDSVHSFILWQRKNDTVFTGSGWEMRGKDSIPSEIDEISNSSDEILLSMEVFGKNDGNPSEYKLVSNKNGEHVFENTSNDFPKRIIYILKPDGSLYFRMEGTSDGQERFEEKKLTKMK